jgi:hypothetical protein
MNKTISNKLTSITAGLGLILALTLVSCSTVSTEKINDQLPGSGTQTNPPVTTPPGTTPPSTTPPVTDPITVSSGTLVEITPGHPTTGTAKLIKTAEGKYIARLENLSTIGGPDVVVWVSETDALNNGALNASKYTVLEKLKSTNGNQNYDIPAGVDVTKIKSIVIWCRLAGIAFGGAALK